jgi:hypothetical protein
MHHVVCICYAYFVIDCNMITTCRLRGVQRLRLQRVREQLQQPRQVVFIKVLLFSYAL